MARSATAGHSGQALHDTDPTKPKQTKHRGRSAVLSTSHTTSRAACLVSLQGWVPSKSPGFVLGDLRELRGHSMRANTEGPLRVGSCLKHLIQVSCYGKTSNATKGE